MMRWTDRTIRTVLGLQGPETDAVYSAVATDSRSLAPASLFVALRGEHFDAHDFLAAAAAAGATGAVVREGTPEVPGLTLYRVADPLHALGELACARRREVAGPVIAVTGTNGKTSTKQMLAAALATRYRTHATRSNLNNLVGVPLTILEAPEGTEALVIEAGANQLGEMARHREVIEPSLTVITNVAAGHLEGFGSNEQLMREKLALADQVALAVVGTDPPELAQQARGQGTGGRGQGARRVISAGLAGADRLPTSVELTAEGKPRVTISQHHFVLNALGKHQAANAMLAWTVGEVLGLDPAKVAASLTRLELPGGRGELRQYGGITVLHDAYNANPSSFRAAIELAKTLRGQRRLVFVAGTMRELGEASAAHHREIAALLLGLRADLLCAVGEFVAPLEAQRAALGERLLTAPDAAALAPLLAARLQGDELVVLKGSRGVALERLLPDLAARASATI